VYEVALPVHVPFVVDRTWPWMATPFTVGGVLIVGVATADVVVVAVAVPLM
jgi:hypothetical protein